MHFGAGSYTLKASGVFFSAKLSAALEENQVKRTFQPNTRHQKKTHGFRIRMRTRGGRAIIARRRQKGRARLTH